MRDEPRHEPQGALAQSDGGVLWRVWAPSSPGVHLATWPADGGKAESGKRRAEVQGRDPIFRPPFSAFPEVTEMTPEGFGYFTLRRAGVEEGLRYAYQLVGQVGNLPPREQGGDLLPRELSGEQLYPDPASRWQPEGIHRPSAVFLPAAYSWSDSAWRGVPREELVIYELHVGTFTPEGTLDAVIPRLSELAALGATALEIMPVAQFPGARGWGYDGVHPYAVQNSYGGPRALQRLVDAAHGAGLGVILDVVYNHLGPEGNYLGHFGPYFTDRYHTPWGDAINFDGPDCDAVRQFFIDNACAWVRDFHADGLRLDAVQTIYDLSARHILADIQAAVQAEAQRQERIVHVIAETNQNDVRLVKPPAEGGFGLDCVWSDDFHHSVHALLTGQRDGYYQDFGCPEDLAKAYSSVFVHDGCYSPFHRRRHGSRVGTLDRTHFVVCVQNHDQVGNRVLGDRFGTLLAPEAQRLACGLLLLCPCVPLLFMGEEYGETSPFPFFCSFEDPALAEAVRRGRLAEFAGLRFKWASEIPDPVSPETFAAAKLHWAWPEGSRQAGLRRLYQDLLAARRRWGAGNGGWGAGDEGRTDLKSVPRGGREAGGEWTAGPHPNPLPMGEGTHTAARVVDDAVLVIERGAGGVLRAIANLTPQAISLPAPELPAGHLVLSTEDVRYGGNRFEDQPVHRLSPYEMLVFSREFSRD